MSESASVQCGVVLGTGRRVVELVVRGAGGRACLFDIECVGRSVGRSVDLVELCADSGESSVDESDLEAVGDAAHASVELTANVVLRARVAGGGVGDGKGGLRGGEDGSGFGERGRGHVAGATSWVVGAA